MSYPVIYMDHNATTPVDSRVLNAMLPYFSRDFGNAASTGHVYGQTAGNAVKRQGTGCKPVGRLAERNHLDQWSD